uniref:IS66 family transposase n=1 Tax=Prevotella heparinolytica TaxID=28113 RepID=UPI00359F397D
EKLMIQAHREQEAESNRYFSTDEMNAIKKLEEYKENYFAWVYDFALPTTNNLSETGLRMTKTKQKVSGQFSQEETAAEFAAVRSYTETCRKNGVNEYEALERLMSGKPYTLKEILAGRV